MTPGEEWYPEIGERYRLSWQQWSDETFGAAGPLPPPIDALENDVRESDRDGFALLRIPGSKIVRPDGSTARVDSPGSRFAYSGVIDLPGLLDLSDIEEVESYRLSHETKRDIAILIGVRRREIEDRISHQVREKIRWDVFGGDDFPNEYRDREHIGAILYASDAQHETCLEIRGGELSGRHRLDITMHLWHRDGDNPKAALAKGVVQIAQSVASHVLRQLEYSG
ncbi:hypothetical protein JYT20_00080 [Rhodothermus sp. AH-315-K08]|nr:hypothetical protein [Rhodothermus sp. AH-315-K08]